MRVVGAVLAVAGALWTLGAAAPATWTAGVSIPGVLDVAGPRSDGRLVVAASGRLYLLDPAGGAPQRFADGPNGYAGSGGGEPYIALSPGAGGPGCAFDRDDLFVLQLEPAGGIVRIDPTGVAHRLATVDGVDSLNGIAFDSTGAFGRRLLVTGPHAGRTTVAAVDCTGAVAVITRQAPVLEGGIAVAPAGFGAFGGDLIAPDELSGTIYAISPAGESRVVSRPDLPTGGDIGVEGAGFVPPGPVAGVTAYFADRGTPGNPHAGTDHLLALTGAELARAGVRSGDLLVATEGGAGMVGVRCAASCTWYPVVANNPTSHGEGHLLVVAGAPSPAFTAVPAVVRSTENPTPFALLGAIAGAVLLALLGAAAVVLRRRRTRS